MSPHEKYHCWAAAQYKSKVRSMFLPWRSSISKSYSLTLTSPGSRGHHQHLRRGKQLIPRAGHPPPKACESRVLECAPTRVANIPHLRAFPTSQTLLRPTPIKRPPTNSILRDSGRLMRCVLKICHPRKVGVIRALEAHPRHRQVPAIHLSTYHLVRFPHFPSCKRTPWVP